MISAKRLREVLKYNPKTGHFTRIKMTGCKGHIGAIVGSKKKHGYIAIQIDGERDYAHRLAWLYMKGRLPKEIDHRNGIRSDNRWENLRKATRFQNNGNRKKHRGPWPKGVVKIKVKRPHYKSFWARIHFNNRVISLGLFHTPQEAHQAYLTAAKKQFGSYARAQ